MERYRIKYPQGNMFYGHDEFVRYPQYEDEFWYIVDSVLEWGASLEKVN